MLKIIPLTGRLILLSLWVWMSFTLQHTVGNTAVIGNIGYFFVDAMDSGQWVIPYQLAWCLFSGALLLSKRISLLLVFATLYFACQWLVVDFHHIVQHHIFIMREGVLLAVAIILLLAERVYLKQTQKAH